MNKLFLIGSLVVGGMNHSAQAQVTSIPGQKYREFTAKIEVSSGELKSVNLEVNTELSVHALGDPEIPHHGHFDYYVYGSVVEGEKRCNFEVLITQTTLKQWSTKEIMESSRDRAGNVRLCSGLSLELSSVKTLMLDGSATVALRASGLNKAIGTGTITSNGLKPVPENDPYED